MRLATPATAGCSPTWPTLDSTPGPACDSARSGDHLVARHGVDITDSLDAGIASLEQHRVYLDALPDGTTGKKVEPFLRGMAAATGPRLGVELATTFEIIPL